MYVYAGIRHIGTNSRFLIFGAYGIPNVKYHFTDIYAPKMTRKPNKTYLMVHRKKLL